MRAILALTLFGLSACASTDVDGLVNANTHVGPCGEQAGPDWRFPERALGQLEGSGLSDWDVQQNCSRFSSLGDTLVVAPENGFAVRSNRTTPLGARSVTVMGRFGETARLVLRQEESGSKALQVFTRTLSERETTNLVNSLRSAELCPVEEERGRTSITSYPIFIEYFDGTQYCAFYPPENSITERGQFGRYLDTLPWSGGELIGRPTEQGSQDAAAPAQRQSSS